MSAASAKDTKTAATGDKPPTLADRIQGRRAIAERTLPTQTDQEYAQWLSLHGKSVEQYLIDQFLTEARSCVRVSHSDEYFIGIRRYAKDNGFAVCASDVGPTAILITMPPRRTPELETGTVSPAAATVATAAESPVATPSAVAVSSSVVFPQLTLRRAAHFNPIENHRGVLEALIVANRRVLGLPNYTAQTIGPDHIKQWTCTCDCAFTHVVASIGIANDANVVPSVGITNDAKMPIAELTIQPQTAAADMCAILRQVMQLARRKTSVELKIRLRSTEADLKRKIAEAKTSSDVFDLYHYVTKCLESPAAYQAAVAATVKA